MDTVTLWIQLHINFFSNMSKFRCKCTHRMIYENKKKHPMHTITPNLLKSQYNASLQSNLTKEPTRSRYIAFDENVQILQMQILLMTYLQCMGLQSDREISFIHVPKVQFPWETRFSHNKTSIVTVITFS